MTVDVMPAPARAPRGTVDADNPWPGLVPFRETDQRFFRGRGKEVQELSRMVMRARLTVLFGTSGLGKSSLLKAGLYPALREQLLLPISIRFDYTSEVPDLVKQIRDEITHQAAEAGAEAPPFRDGETLWEYFHRRDADFWDKRNRPLLPLLVFDQFEEIFTVGRRDSACVAAGQDLVRELAWLAEGSPPPGLQARLEETPEQVRDFAFGRHHYKLLVTLREDYLAELEQLRSAIPSIAQNRLRLTRMKGRAALRVVWLGSPHLIDLTLADPLVRFVANASPEDSLDDIEVEPALLSVVCRKLNNKRRQRGDEKITGDLLAGSQDSILDEFYESSISDLGSRIRTFVEDRLLTIDDHRDSIAVGNALGIPGVTQEAIDTLVARRLVKIEESAGSSRLELTHDLLVGAIAASRARRKQRRARRWTWALGTVAAALLVFGLFGVHLLLEARRQQFDERRLRVAAEWADQDGERALAVLLELRTAATGGETNPPALFPALASAFGNSVGTKYAQVINLQPSPEKTFFSPDGTLLVTASQDQPLRVQTVDNSSQPVVLPASGGTLLSGAFSRDGKRLVAGYGDGGTRVWSTGGADPPVALVVPGAPVLSVAFSHDGARLVTGHGDGTARIWNSDGSGEPVVLEGHQGPVQDASFNPNGALVVTASEDNTSRIWDSGTGSSLRTLVSEDDVWSATFSPDGRRIVTTSSDKKARVWNADGLGEPVVLGGHEGPVVSAVFSPGGTRIVTASVDGTARVWNADGYGRPVVLQQDASLAGAGFLGDEIRTRVFATSRTGTVRAWPAVFDSIREQIRSEISTCLDAEFRQTELGEKPREAQENYDLCTAQAREREDGS